MIGASAGNREINGVRWQLVAGKRTRARVGLWDRGEAAVGGWAPAGGPDGSSCGQQINDVFDSFVGSMVRGLEATVGSVLRVGSMVKAAVGKGTAQALVEEEKQ